MGGNYKTLESYFKKKLNKASFKGIYFGDTVATDMFCRFLPNWDTAFILPELDEEHNEIKFSEEMFDYRKVLKKM